MSIANDSGRLNALIDAMACYLDQTLRLTDPAAERDDLHWKHDAGVATIERSRADTLATTLYAEARYLPTTDQLDYLEELEDATDKAARADRLATELLRVCDGAEGTGEDDANLDGVSESGAVALAPYASWWAYFNYVEVDMSCGLVVGGLGRMLQDRITAIAEEWLHECDRVLCLVHDCTPANDDEIDALVSQHSRDISRRITLHNKNANSPFARVDQLAPASLGARNEIEFTRVRVQAQCRARNDLRALQALKVLAREPMSVEAKTIFETQLPLLQMIVTRPPQELGLVGENARRMNLAMLSRCLMPGIEVSVRMQIARAWSNRHGLDDEGARVVRLCSFVWQLVGVGAFEQGVMSASLVSEVAFEVMQLARLGRELIEHVRMRSCMGVRLLSFNQSIADRSSDLASELDKAQCCLSNFSLRDVNDAFHPHKPLLERVYMELTRRTRVRLGNGRTPLVPSNYEAFVGDALALLLPAVEARRLQIDMPHNLAPHPLGDMLRTVTKCNKWSPLDGKCVLDLDDLRGAHPKIRQVLEHYAGVGPDSFINATHKNGSGHRRVGFEFESARLLQLLKM